MHRATIVNMAAEPLNPIVLEWTDDSKNDFTYICAATLWELRIPNPTSIQALVGRKVRDLLSKLKYYG